MRSRVSIEGEIVAAAPIRHIMQSPCDSEPGVGAAGISLLSYVQPALSSTIVAPGKMPSDGSLPCGTSIAVRYGPAAG